jgi:AcrR family transcriptional regulator
MPKRNSSYMAAQRERILEAALQRFAEHGLHNTSIEQIAQAAGCGKSVIYAHFDSKTAIVQAIARQQLREVEEQGLRSVADLTAFLIAGYARLESPELRKKHRLALHLTVESLNDPELRDWLNGAFNRTLDLMQSVIREDPATAHWSARKARDTARQLAFFWAGQGLYKMLFPSLPLRMLKQDMKQMVAALTASAPPPDTAGRNTGARHRR